MGFAKDFLAFLGGGVIGVFIDYALGEIFKKFGAPTPLIPPSIDTHDLVIQGVTAAGAYLLYDKYKLSSYFLMGMFTEVTILQIYDAMRTYLPPATAGRLASPMPARWRRKTAIASITQ